MILSVTVNEFGQRKPVFTGNFSSASMLFAALMQHAPWVAGFRVRSRMHIKWREFAMTINVPPSITIPDFDRRSESAELAKNLMQAAIKAARKVAPEMFPNQ